MIDYYFGRLDGGMKRGRDALASAFAHSLDPVQTLVREALQNVSGAREKDKIANVEIEFLQMPANVIPKHEKLSRLIKMSAAALSGVGANKDATPFETSAHRLTTAKNISVLKISDFGTTGLTAERWDKLMGWIGVNSGVDNEPGSYGLGRGAFFTASRCNTVFYSSKAADGYRFAGKSYLPSFEVDGEWRQGDGTYGQEGQKPITELDLIPEYFRRPDQGTSIWIIDYDANEDVEERMIRSVLAYFWPAIRWGILEVKIGKTNIKAANLREVMSNYYNINDKNTRQNPNPLHFLDTYEIPQEKIIKETLNILGKVEYYGNISSEQPYSGMTALLRDTGMIIYFTKKNTPIKFTGVFVCIDEKGSAVLRRMENPTHTEWNPIHWLDNNRQTVQAGKDAKVELDVFVEKAIGQITSQGVGGRFDLISVSGVNEYGTDSNNNAHQNIFDEEKLAIEETGMEIGADDADVLAATHSIRPVRVPREPVNRTNDIIENGKVIILGQEVNDSDNEKDIRFGIDNFGKNEGLLQIKNFGARCYVTGTGKNISYRFVVRTEKKYAKKKIIASLSAVTEEGSAIHVRALSCKADVKFNAKLKDGSIILSLDSNGACVFSASVEESMLISPTINIQLLS